MPNIISDNVQSDGSEQVLYDDGTTVVTDTFGNVRTYDPRGNLVSNDGVSLASQSPSPPVQPTNAPTSNTLALSSLANSLGAFGVSITSLITGRPAVVTRSGAVATNTNVQPQFNIGALLLLGLGVLILVKVLK